MRNKKIAILGSRGIPAVYGGFETFAEELAVRTVSSNVSVTVYCISDGMDKLKSYKGIRLVYVISPCLGPLTTILFDLLCLWHARKDYDIVYMLGYGSSLFCWIPRLWGSTVWINMDGVEWARAKWGYIAKTYFKVMEVIAMRTADRIIADAEGIREFLYSRHRIATPCSVIPYGASIVEQSTNTDFIEKNMLQKGNYYLMVCRLEPENHIREILTGFVASQTRSLLVVIGNHRTGTAYVKQLLSIRDDRIRFLGPLYDRHDIQALRYHCLAYIHGHSVGGTNPSLLEALGCGNIILAHDNVFNREVAGDAGLFFKTEHDIPTLLAGVDGMDAASRSAWSERSRKRIRDNYTWDKITELYADLIQAGPVISASK